MNGSQNIFFYIVIAALVLIFIVLFWCIRKERQQNLEMLELVFGVTEVGDPSLDGHSLNVLYLTMLLYDFLPFRYRLRLNRRKLAYAALMLDLGKFGIPSRIRNKKGKLSEEEWQMMRQHPEFGKNLVGTIPAIRSVQEWILYHHEHVDGSGYYKRKGAEIPLASRLLAVTDTYSAITMVRPYRPSLPYEDAIMELKLVAGTQLDQELVDCFCNIPPKRINERIDQVRRKMECYTQEHITEG